MKKNTKFGHIPKEFLEAKNKSNFLKNKQNKTEKQKLKNLQPDDEIDKR